jgi:L-lactate dehydrogenase (cytochrome)
VAANGPAANGPAANGPAANGPAANGPAANGPAAAGVRAPGPTRAERTGERARTALAGLRRYTRPPTQLVTVERARTLARRRLPRVVFDYLDGAAETETTARANRRAMLEVTFRPRMGVTAGVPAPDLATTVLGHPVSMPVLLSPIGFTRSMNAAGDVAGARAAGTAGTIFTLSSMSGHTIEEVAAAGTGPLWFQLYFLGGRRGAAQLVERAARAGFEALVVTMDTQIPGNRERDLRHRASMPLRFDPAHVARYAPQVAVRPGWLADATADRFQLTIANATTLGPPDRPFTVDEALIEWAGAPPRWEDFEWLRREWPGPVIAKGIVTADDARRAVDAGCAAIIVSNHGGRQLDGLPGSLASLVEVLDAVGHQVEVLVDGGIRRGSDVVRAVAIGARAVMVGRAWAYGLAAGGQPGVDQILALLRSDTDRTLRVLGCGSVAELSADFVDVPAAWHRPAPKAPTTRRRSAGGPPKA